MAKRQKNKFHAGDMEIHIARYFNYRANLIVPNVSWGLGFQHELDLLVVRKSGYAIEIEIKVSLSDLKAERNKKKHQHCSKKIKALYYAVPQRLLNRALELIPTHAGLIIVRENPKTKYEEIKRVYIAKQAKYNNNRKLNDKELDKLRELAAMRLWSLKEHNYLLLRQAEYWRQIAAERKVQG
jgi:hypothetical protein